MPRSDLIDVTVKKIHETANAWLVTEDDEKKVWVPKSQCELEPVNGKDVFVLTLPEWLAIEKELI